MKSKTTNTSTCASRYMKVVITKATTMLRGSSVYQPSYKSMVGKTILVRRSNQCNYFETKSGYPVLVTDCRPATRR